VGREAALDRETRIALLAHHARHSRHRGKLEGAEVAVPGGNPGCGDVVTVYLKTDGAGRLEQMRFEGEGCTLSQAAASLLAERLNRSRPTLEDLLALPDGEIMDEIGRDIADHRPLCATLALGVAKAGAKALDMNRKLRRAGKTEQEIAALRAAAVPA
jgi:nitrogen fixation NifU-like protein